MCVSCGCGRPNDDHGDSRNITLNDLDQAAIAAGTTRDKVLQNMMGGTGNTSSTSDQQVDQSGASSIAQSWPGGANRSSDSQLPADQPAARPGQTGKQLGTESGTAWQESQQMGKTGQGGIQSPEQDY
jgi:hypothetical protein